MTVELKYLAVVTASTALMWIPYMLNMITGRGLLDVVGYPENPKPMAPWATRMKAAHCDRLDPGTRSSPSQQNSNCRLRPL